MYTYSFFIKKYFIYFSYIYYYNNFQYQFLYFYRILLKSKQNLAASFYYPVSVVSKILFIFDMSL